VTNARPGASSREHATLAAINLTKKAAAKQPFLFQMKSFQDYFNTGCERIENRKVYSEDCAIGILRPSTLWGNDGDGNFYISGPGGISRASSNDPDSFWSSLIAAKAILFGTKKEIEQCLRHLDDESTSRTSSFLMSTSENCGDFLAKIRRLHSSRALILGCGGIGSLAAINMAGAGVKHLHLIDGDVIEPSNMNRQFFWTPKDKGRKKVEILQREIKIRYPETECSASDEFISEDGIKALAKNFDILLLTADEPLGLGASLAELPNLAVAGGGYFHQYISFGVNESRLPDTEPISWQRTPFFVGPSFGPTNTELAGMLSSFSIQFLAANPEKRSTEAFTSFWNASEFPRNIALTTKNHDH
jgi:molybdopterin-synthase adenylyltransferase